VHADVILHHFRHQPVDGAAGTSDELHDVGAADFLFEGAFDRFDLPANSPHPIEELGLLADRVGPCGTPILKIGYPTISYSVGEDSVLLAQNILSSRTRSEDGQLLVNIG
jgi:hypothetical protein